MTRQDHIYRLAIHLDLAEREWERAPGIKPGRLWWLAEKTIEYVEDYADVHAVTEPDEPDEPAAEVAH